ncbi:MAG: hypothetical protein Q8N39_07895 [Pelolinea sp.]|nr:hypothetical protein [Pelolinea sp.]
MDFLYYPLVSRNGIESVETPNALLTGAPRGSHRHRIKDALAVLLSLSGDHRYSPEEIQELLKSASDIFFGAQGSVTRAMQTACDQVNKLILERNLDRGYDGIRAVGSINLIALHNDWLFVAQYGSTVTTLISTEQYDEFGASEGQSETLGQSKRIQARFYQSGIKPGDLILMNGKAPASWSSYYLAGSAALTMPQVKRRLLNQATGDLEAIVIKCAEGSGQVITQSWAEAVDETSVQEESVSTSPIKTDGEEDNQISDVKKVEDKSSYQETEDSGERMEPRFLEKQTLPDEVIYLGEKDVPVMAGETEKPDLSAGKAQTENIPEKTASPALVRMARTWMNARTFNAKIRQGIERTRKKIFPKYKPSQSPASPVFSFFMAISLPLVLILVSATVYTRTGKAEQYAIYMEQAQNAALLAREEKKPLQQHTYWAQALDMVKSAENYNVTQNSRMLYEQAQFLLDEMDLAARLDFRPALTQFFPEGVVISRIKASSSGVYLLDKTSGSVLRIFLNSKGFYEIDDEFKCVPGPYGLETLTDLVDFVILPANADNFRIMALDTQGNLLYCRPGELAVSRTLSAPENGWGCIIGVVYDNDTLYVLDADKDAVWMYAGKDPNKPDVETATGIVFSESPIKYLGEDVPDFGGAIDLVVNQEDLYVLNADGHMTQCRYSADKKVRLTECQEPSPYTDNRVGRPDKKPWIFADASFSMAQATRLPNASIYLLDTTGQSIYQFSYQLNLERVLRALYNKNYPVPASSPSGFGITPESDLFLAFDNRLFIAPLQ